MRTSLYSPIFINPQAYYVFPLLYDVEPDTKSFIELAVFAGTLIVQSSDDTLVRYYSDTKVIDLSEFANKTITISQATNIGTTVLGQWKMISDGIPSPDLYYDLSLKSNEHPTRNIIDDMSGNGRHATIYNALYAKGSGYGESGYEGAFVFDGIDDYARIENITKGFKTLFMEVVPFKTGGILFDQRMMDGVQVGGRNLIIMSRVSKNKYLNSLGEILDATLFSITDYIKVTPNTSYIHSYSDNYGSAPSVCFYDSNKQFISSLAGRKRESFKTPSNAMYLRTCLYNASINEEKLEIGNKATDWTPAPEDVFAISNLPNTIAYNGMNPNGVTYINGELNTNKYTDDMQNHRQVITIVNPTDTTHGSVSIGAAYDFKTYISSMALYKVIGFYDELTPAQIQKVITKYNLKYEQI